MQALSCMTKCPYVSVRSSYTALRIRMSIYMPRTPKLVPKLIQRLKSLLNAVAIPLIDEEVLKVIKSDLRSDV